MKKHIRKRRKILSEKHKKATTRNWSKKIIAGSIIQFTNLCHNGNLSFQEQMKLLKCKQLLEEIIVDWKSVL